MLHTDGGGRKLAALNVIIGADKVKRFFAGLISKGQVIDPIWLISSSFIQVSLLGMPTSAPVPYASMIRSARELKLIFVSSTISPPARRFRSEVRKCHNRLPHRLRESYINCIYSQVGSIFCRSIKKYTIEYTEDDMAKDSLQNVSEHDPIPATTAGLCRLPCPMPDIVKLVGGKWKLIILQILIFDGTKRFGELKRRLDGVTQTMLTNQLRALEQDGLITRTVHAEVPPRVEYTATSLAHDLKDVFFAMRDWWKRNHPSKE